GARLHHRRGPLPGPPRADGAGALAPLLPRLREADARLRHAVGLLLVLPVPHHLVGQPAGGDRLVRAARPRRLGVDRPRARRLPLRAPLRAPLVARFEAPRPAPRRGGTRDAPHALDRPLLAGRAGLPQRRVLLLLALPGGAPRRRRPLARRLRR